MKRLCFLLLLSFFGIASGLNAQRGHVLEVTPLFNLDVDATKAQISALAPIELAPFLFDLLTDIDYGIIGARVKYVTVDYNGNFTTATGLVVVPQTACPKDLMVYCHGTIFAKDGVPSNLAGLEVIFGLIYGGNGYLTILPDYLGLGTGNPDFHLFVDERTEASATIDLMKATKNYADFQGISLSNKAFISGYSQGGHAGMSAFKALQLYGNAGFNVKSAGLGAGPYDLSTTQYNYIVDNVYYPEPEFILYVIASCQAVLQSQSDNPKDWLYEEPSDFLVEPYASKYASEILGQTGDRSWLPPDYTVMFRPGFFHGVVLNPNKPVRQYLEASDVFDWNNRKPTALYYCTQDEKVDYHSSLLAEAAFEDNLPWYLFWMKALINSVYIGPLDHGQCVIPYALLSKVQFDLQQSHCWNKAGRASDQLAQQPALQTPPVNYYWLELNGTGPIARLDLLRMDGSVAATYTDLKPVDGQIRVDVRDLERMAYGLRITAPSGTEQYLITSLEPVRLLRHADYDPLTYDPATQEVFLDLTLLPDPVQTLTLYDAAGSPLREMDGASATDRFAFSAEGLANGSYILEVKTATNSYFLPLEVVRNTRTSPDIRLYPNPAYQSVRVQLSPGKLIRSATLYDLQGRVVWQQTSIDRPELELTPNLPAGVYELHVVTDQGAILTEKLVLVDNQ